MSSSERKKLDRKKLKAEGLQEGSELAGAIYDEDQVCDLILITSVLL